MKRKKKVVSLLLVVALSAGMIAGCSSSKDTAKDNEEVTVTFLNCWSGSELPSGVDSKNNPVADVIAEKTGVRVEYLPCTTSEIERLNLAFSTGDIADIVSAPFWGRQSAETLVIKKAAKEGLLMPLNDLIEQYAPNLSDSFTFRLDEDYLTNDINDPDFNGEHYYIPADVPMTDEDVQNQAYNAYIRKDILETLNVDPESINSSEKLYELMKQIKEYGFKDVNGNDIIVSGTWQSGWTYEPFYNSYVSQRDMFSEFKHENGEIKLYQNTERYAQQILFMRKLISEGLIDVECMEQSSAIAAEKMSTGKIGIIGTSYTHMKNNLENTLYKTNPEMEYVPLGPIMNLDGEPYQNTGVSRRGAQGCVIFINKNTKNAESIMKLLNFMNSEEGMLLNRYGIEGVHYTMVDGKPRLTDEWQQKYNEDPNSLKKEGIGVYTKLVRKVGNISMYGESTYGVDPNADEAYNKAKEASPQTFVDDVYSLSYVAMKYEKWDEISTLLSTGDGGLMKKAMFAATEEEAWDYINQSRAIYEKGGIKEFEAWMTEHQNDRN